MNTLAVLALIAYGAALGAWVGREWGKAAGYKEAIRLLHEQFPDMNK